MKRLTQLVEQITAKDAEVQTLYDQIGDETPDKALIDQIKSLNSELKDLNEEATELKQIQDARETSRRTVEGFAEVKSGVPFPVTPDGPVKNVDHTRRAKSLGEQFIESEAWKGYLAQIAPNGSINEKAHVASPAVHFKDLVTGTWENQSSGGALVTPDYKPYVDIPFRPLTMRQLVTNGQTNSDTVSFPRWVDGTNNAAIVPEATGTDSETDTLKPISELELERVVEYVRTIAHLVPVTKQALADAGQMRTIIDTFLRDGLEQVLEDQMLTGSGGDEFTGILETTGIGTQTFDTDILTTTRKARTKVRLEGRATPTAYVFNPLDWETIDLLTNDEGNFYFGGPMVLGTPRLWGVPVVESEAMEEGTFVIADWRQAVLWDRQQATISVTDSHADWFRRNIVAVLAELRAAFGVLRPAAFIAGEMATS